MENVEKNSDVGSDDKSVTAKNTSKEKSEKCRRRFNGRIHIASTIVLIMISMMVLDGYLVQQNMGSRRTGVMVMLLIGDVCLLFVLRYVGVWVGAEVHTPKRGCSMAEWFLFVFVLDIKMYFIIEGIRKECVELFGESSLLLENDKNKDDLNPDLKLQQKEELFNQVIETCDYSMLTKKTLTLFQSIFVPGLYILLVGADYLENLADFRSLEEVKMRTFWVLVDLLDLLDLQATIWESKYGDQPYLSVSFIYFYCYIVLIVLPPLSLAELSKKNEIKPHAMVVYLLASFVTVNVATTIIRLTLLLRHNLGTVSAVFIGKNIVCACMKITKLLQLYLIKRKRLKFTKDSETPTITCQLCSSFQPPNGGEGCVPSGKPSLYDDNTKLQTYCSMFSDEDSIDCPQHGRRSNNMSNHINWKPSATSFSSIEKPSVGASSTSAVNDFVSKYGKFQGKNAVDTSIDLRPSPCSSMVDKYNCRGATPLDDFREENVHGNDNGERSSLLVHSGSVSSMGFDGSPFQSSEKKVRFRKEKDALKRAALENIELPPPDGVFNNKTLSDNLKSPPSTEASCSTLTNESVSNGVREWDLEEGLPSSYSNPKLKNTGLYRLSEDVQNEEENTDAVREEKCCNGIENHVSTDTSSFSNLKLPKQADNLVRRSTSVDRLCDNIPKYGEMNSSLVRSDSESRFQSRLSFGNENGLKFKRSDEDFNGVQRSRPIKNYPKLENNGRVSNELFESNNRWRRSGEYKAQSQQQSNNRRTLTSYHGNHLISSSWNKTYPVNGGLSNEPEKIKSTRSLKTSSSSSEHTTV